MENNIRVKKDFFYMGYKITKFYYISKKYYRFLIKKSNSYKPKKLSKKINNKIDNKLQAPISNKLYFFNIIKQKLNFQFFEDISLDFDGLDEFF